MYKKGRRLKGKGFSLIFLANDLSRSRLGISVHRLIRGAVRRNRMKRIIREIYRLHQDLFPGSCDIVFTVAPDFRLRNAEDVRQAVAGLAGRQASGMT
ncbi:MAG: ribonuclease P protein component [Desulfobulbaceae bacterium]|nr:ribonuclease P protein component [Desulfobulbaceae bacterium]